MLEVATAIVAAILVWWGSTGVILALGRLSQATLWLVMIKATAASVVAVLAMVALAPAETVAAVYLSFAAGLMVWAWHEMSFLFGFLTGPRRSACPAGASGITRWRYAFETVAHHEIALAITMVLLLALTWGTANQTGAWLFALLWIMRVSAKLNVFLGVPNMAEEFLPDRLAYLKTYFRGGRASAFFPVSVTLTSVGLGVLIYHIAHAAPGAETVALTLLATMLALAVIEHWFLVLPVRDSALWAWALAGDPVPGHGRLAMCPHTAEPAIAAATPVAPASAQHPKCT